MIEKFEDTVAKICKEFQEEYTDLVIEYIEYGAKLVLTDADYCIETIIIYNSRNSLKIVYNEKNPNLKRDIPKILSKYQLTLDVTDKPYIGLDESGKGDYFGPLVIGGFVSEPPIDKQLIELGVRDCKELSDEKVLKISEQLKRNYSRRISIYQFEPIHYNQLYSKQKLQGGNMTAIIELGQNQVITNLHEQYPDVSCILSDAITSMEHFKESQVVNSQQIPYVQIINAERNMAVAAAGILARAQFLTWLAEQSALYQIPLYKGADKKVIDSAVRYMDRYGKKELIKVAKVHFKTTQKVMSRCHERV